MRNFIRGLVLVLFLSGLVFGSYQLFLFIKNRQTASPPGDEQPVQKCNFKEGTCAPVTATAETGQVRVLVTVEGKMGAAIEVDLFTTPNPEDNLVAYVKVSDQDGKALFEAVPAGTYYVFFNNTGFPKEFGEAEGLGPVGQKVEIVKGQTGEFNLDLRRSQ
jgi:hypothetical protein